MEPIVTSRSAYISWQACNRKRWLQYEAPNGGATGVNGWERIKFAMAPTTGIFLHHGLVARLSGKTPQEAVRFAREGFMSEVKARGLEVEVGADESFAIEEQAALVEAMIYAWCRVREPIWAEAFETVDLEREQRVALAEDVILETRSDWIVRRRSDRRLFIVNFKSVNQPDYRWVSRWETDLQLMTELLAAEQRYGEPFGGVIIEGLVKGRRQQETDSAGTVIGYRETSKLIYGYKCDADPPLVPLQYDWAYTRKKGWYRFPVWKESMGTSAMSAIEYWVTWLPEEAVEQSFVAVPPILRNQPTIDSMVRQFAAAERRIKQGGAAVNSRADGALDVHFPQNFHSCVYPSKCPMYAACHEPGVAENMAAYYTARVPHHVSEEGATE